MKLSGSAETDLYVRIVQTFVDWVPARMSLRYTADDPYALHATFRIADVDKAVEWTFSRDLVAEGLTRRTGEGDVQIWPAAVGPAQDVLYVALGSRGRRALIEVPLVDLETFLRRTQSVVPWGAESGQFDIDAEFSHLLAGG
ncbi:SsgA family sporulation/cell division regulator [Streptomyces sp. NPDC047706]|uniref:SsgA family sporulation/cell division regulator n=1 Tax=Streptomyces sp. NPDC047706 TaxID=3365486 RepID=UPI003715C006